MNRPMLDLVRERIDHGLEQARRVPLVGHLGALLGVVEQPPQWTPSGGLRRYNDVAEAGAVFAATGSPDARAKFIEGISWLRQRRFFVPDQPPGLEADPVALVGLALGFLGIDDASDGRPWLAEIVGTALKGEGDKRRADLLKLALALAVNDSATWSELSPALKAAFAKKGKVALPSEERQQALGAILEASPLDPEWAVLHAAALDTLFSMEAAIDVSHVTVEQLVDLLRRVPAALKRWPWKKGKPQQRWDIQDEYLVQSLLWALLRPVVPDLEDEESLPSLGHKHPRADLLVPALRLVIEVKFLREATQNARAKVIEEISADTGLYLTDQSAYDVIVAFVWDNTGSTHHHDELAAGLRKLRGIHDVVIVSRPGEWKA